MTKPFWKNNIVSGESGSDKTVTVGDGESIQFKSHGRGHPMLDGMCFNCGFDEKTCECVNPDIQNPRPCQSSEKGGE